MSVRRSSLGTTSTGTRTHYVPSNNDSSKELKVESSVKRLVQKEREREREGMKARD